MKRIIDNSCKDDYYSQINNKLVPFSACNTTAMIMFCKGNKVAIPVDPSYDQPEDSLTAFTLTDEATQAVKKITPWFINPDGTLIVPAREIHLVLDWCTNKWIGKQVVSFTQFMHIADIISKLKQGQVMLCSGKFTPSGHFTTLVGFEYDDLEIGGGKEYAVSELINLDSFRWIIDDPYGDWHTNYEDHHGNDIRFSHKEFMSITDVSNQDAKWIHYYIGA